MKAKILFLALFLPLAALAKEPSPIATREISQLFVALQSSKCEFFRNGDWYSADKARDHLHRKYEYLLEKGLVTSAESFIELAATKSSASGKPYLVRCGAAEAIPSKSWFTRKLKDLRG